MEKIIINKKKLKSEDINRTERRVKVLLINSKEEITLAYSYNEYQFPGGHVEDREDLSKALNRELYEETGMDLDVSDIEPFLFYAGYYDNYPYKGMNSKIIIYYYVIYTDEEPNTENSKCTNYEQNGKFELRKFPLSDVSKEIKKNVKLYGDPNNIAKEMLLVLKTYKELFK